jgi:hypothetical protein
VNECGLADESDCLSCGGRDDLTRSGRLSGSGTGEPFDREDARNRFGDIEGENPSSGGAEGGNSLSTRPTPSAHPLLHWRMIGKWRLEAATATTRRTLSTEPGSKETCLIQALARSPIISMVFSVVGIPAAVQNPSMGRPLRHIS